MFKKTMSLLLAAVLSAGLFASCSGNGAGNSSAPVSGDPSSCSEQQAEPVTLSFLFGDSVMMDWFVEYFPEYISGENPDRITVEPEYQQEANKVLQVKAAAGEVPDLISAGLPQEMVDQGRFLDLSNESWWDDLAPAAKELSTDVKSGKTISYRCAWARWAFSTTKTSLRNLVWKKPKHGMS